MNPANVVGAGNIARARGRDRGVNATADEWDAGNRAQNSEHRQHRQPARERNNRVVTCQHAAIGRTRCIAVMQASRVSDG